MCVCVATRVRRRRVCGCVWCGYVWCGCVSEFEAAYETEALRRGSGGSNGYGVPRRPSPRPPQVPVARIFFHLTKGAIDEAKRMFKTEVDEAEGEAGANVPLTPGDRPPSYATLACVA